MSKLPKQLPTILTVRNGIFCRCLQRFARRLRRDGAGRPPPPPPRVYVAPPPPPPPAYAAPAVEVEVQANEPPPPLAGLRAAALPRGRLSVDARAIGPCGGGGYYWVPGTWVQPPRVGVLWTPGYWGFVGGVYAFHAGYWGPHVGFYGGVNYGFGYAESVSPAAAGPAIRSPTTRRSPT